MINLIVENIKYDNNKIVDFTLSTTGNEDIHWGPPNKYVLLHDFQNSDHFKLVSIDHCIRGQVSKDNLFYVLNVSVLEDFTMDNFFGTIPEKSLKYIRENNIPIMLFSPYESIAYGFTYETAHDAQICVRLKEQLKNLGLENNEIVLFSLASYYDTQTGQQKTFESINKNLKNFSWVQSILFLQPHPNNARSHLEITLDDQINSINNKNKLFLCLNRQPRANRSLLLQSLYINDLWKNNIISCRFNLNADGAIHDFVSLLNMHREKNQDDVINHLSKGKNYYVTRKLLTHINYENSLWKFLCKLYSSLFNKNTYQLTLLNEKENLTAWNFEWEKNWYYDTYFSLITETFYYDDFEIVMITEKTFKPLLNFHPFIIFGNAWYNRSLKNLGFITYENIFFNLPEDGYPGNITFFERLHNIVESIQKLNQLSKSELDEKFRSVLDTLRHNYNHLHNTDWIKVQHDLLINRIK